jgi:hypothetical protein
VRAMCGRFALRTSRRQVSDLLRQHEISKRF